MNLQPYLIRIQVIKAIRHFFDERGFQEVIVPTFNVALPLEPNVHSFKTEWHRNDGSQTLYLSTSPESGLKKMMAVGLGNCYAIGKCFRNLEGSGSRHNPEFLMLEWYRADATYHEIMTETQELVLYVKSEIQRIYNCQVELPTNQQWRTLSLVDLFKEHAGLDIAEIIDDDALRLVADAKGYSTENSTWEQLFDQTFLNEVEKHLPSEPCFLIDFPARLSPLCRVNSQKPYLAERFEFFIRGMEIGNGNTENLDVQLVRNNFQREADHRHQVGQAAHPIDETFINALESLHQTGKSYAGIGLGIDRLAMLMAGVDHIHQVEYFTVTD